MNYLKKGALALLGTLMAFTAAVVPVFAEGEETQSVTNHEVSFHATVTDAGQYIDRMTVDYGSDYSSIKSVSNDTFEVKVKETVDYGTLKGQDYPYYDSTKPLEVVKTEVSGSKVTLYFNQAQAGTLTWLSEGRNYPAILNFTITQNSDIEAVQLSTDKRELDAVISKDTNTYSFKENATYADLEDEEVAKFESVLVDDGINYQIHKGSNDALIVWFHGNGEGDFPTKDTNNNVAQMLANRGTVAWASEEAQAVFGDATVIAFQAPSVWYTAKGDNLLEKAYNEIQDVIKANGIDASKVYVSGCSAGGFMTTRMLIAYPNFFKAAMINCPALDIANLRSGTEDAIPTDEELASLKDSSTAIWLVQGETDSSVDPENCSKRIWKILTDGEEVTETKKTEGISAGYTTYETKDNKYKLTLYTTVNQADGTGTLGDTRKMGKIVVKEDYDQDGTYTDVQYNDHWSWIYTLRNDPTDADGTSIWNWAVNYTEQETISTTNQKLIIDGDDWGPAVTTTIVTLDKEVSSVSDVKVTETKEATDWTSPTFDHYNATAERTVTNAYLSDENGNKVDGSSKYVTVEMYVSPSEGSPFIYDMNTGKNSWCNPYTLAVSAKATGTDGETYTVSGENTIDLTKSENRVCPDVDGIFNVDNDYNGIKYGVYTPTTDSDKKALVIWLHGAGEGGEDNYIDLLGNEVTALATEEFQKNFDTGAYVITPQCDTMWMDGGDGQYQNGEKGSKYTEDLYGLIQNFLKTHDDVDPDRVIIGGCSNGGYMTIEMVLKYPELFSKAYPICEAYYDENITDAQLAAVKAAGTEIWFTYAENDTTVDPTKTSVPTIKRMKEAGITVHTSVWADVHDTTGRFTDADGNPYQYAGHWSWIYFDNNENKCDDCGVNEWVWLGQYKKTDDSTKPSDTTKPTDTKKDTTKNDTSKKNPSKTTKTSDDTNIALTLGIGMMAIITTAGIVVFRKKHS